MPSRYQQARPAAQCLLRHPEYNRPELLATGPLQVWSWDITLLRGPQKGVYYRLYVLLDIFSRYVVGWMLAEREDAELAKHFLADTYAKQGAPIDLTIHADNGPAPASESVSRLLRHLGITESHSRPHVSDDNPYSEALFKTKKYRPDFPDRFASLEAARAHCRAFFDWYNNNHFHTGIALLTPFVVHHGLAPSVRPPARRSSISPTSNTPNASSTGAPRRPHSPRRSTSTLPGRRPFTPILQH